MSKKTHKRTRNALLVVAALVSGVVGWGVYVLTSNQEIDQATPHWLPETAQPTTSSRATPQPTRTPQVAIDQSMPLELYFPQLAARLIDSDKHFADIKLDGDVCPIDANNHVQPDLAHMDQACAAYRPSDKDWNYKLQLPGTDNDGQVVLFGHTWRQGQAAFNVLYDWQDQRTTVRPGDELWVRTAASGKRWLVYTFTGTLKMPLKSELPFDQWVWPQRPSGGRLLTIGCRQPDNLGIHSYENLVFEWAFSRVDTR